MRKTASVGCFGGLMSRGGRASGGSSRRSSSGSSDGHAGAAKLQPADAPEAGGRLRQVLRQAGFQVVACFDSHLEASSSLEVLQQLVLLMGGIAAAAAPAAAALVVEGAMA
jgi:hypothetical protein